jgi:Zinc knuckle
LSLPPPKDPRKSFQGACRKCGVIGHKVADCRSSGSKPPGKQGLTALPCTDNAAPATGTTGKPPGIWGPLKILCIPDLQICFNKL